MNGEKAEDDESLDDLRCSCQVKAVFSSDQKHCASGSYEAYFGGGTKLTVLGKNHKTHVSLSLNLIGALINKVAAVRSSARRFLL